MVIYTIVTAILCLVALLVSETGVKDLNFAIIRKTIKKNQAEILLSYCVGIIAYLILTILYEIAWEEAIQWQIALHFAIACAKSDYHKKIIPNRLIITLMLFAVIVLILLLIQHTTYYRLIMTSKAAGGLVTFIFMVICNFLSRGGFGAGDVKFLSALEFLLGIRGIFNVFLFTMISSACTGIFYMITRKKSGKDTMPLGPFILIGIVVPVLLGL